MQVWFEIKPFSCSSSWWLSFSTLEFLCLFLATQISTQYHAKNDTTKHAEDAVVYVRTLLSGVDGYC